MYGWVRAIVGRMAAVGAAVVMVTNTASADVTVIGEAKEKMKASVKTSAEPVLKTKQGKADGKLTTVFQFHDPQTKPETFKKDLKTGELDQKSFSVNYLGTDKHGTDGEVEYKMTVQKVFDDALKVKGFDTVASVKSTITPGTSNPEQDVSILAKLEDPFSFSNFDLDSTFEFYPAGLDLGFSLLAGTSLAVPPTGLANEMSFTQRLAPASINDAGQFWGQPDPGWIDLFRVFIGTGSDGRLTTSIIFGESNRFFDLDFRNAGGVPFDPSDDASVAAIASSITAGFQNGTLGSDLSNVFTVGFAPRSGTMEYTTGNQLVLNISGLETPEPLTAGLVFGGLTALLVWRKIKRAS